MVHSRVDDPTLVSVVIPTYYRNDRLRDAIRSAQTQAYKRVEVIVVDDSGVWNAAPVSEEFDAVTFLAMESNRGWGPALTRGIKSARGKYIQLLDDDDELIGDKLARSIATFRDNSAVGVVYSGVRLPNEKYVRPSHTGNVLREALSLDLWPCYTSSMLIERSVLDAVLPLPRWPAANDDRLMIELARRTRFASIDAPLVRKGNSEDHVGAPAQKVRGYDQILTEYADRYERYPEAKQRAQAKLERWRGYQCMENSYWSPRAIRAFANALRYRAQPQDPGLLLSALLGRHVYAAYRQFLSGS